MKFWDSWTDWLRASLTGKTRKKTEQIADQGSLRLRFLLIVYIALLPVAALSVWQGFDRLRLDQEHVRDNLRQSAYAAASDDLNVFFAAEQMLATLASDPTVRDGETNCRTRLLKALEGPKFIANLARVSAEGTMLCVANPPPRASDPRQSIWWKDAVTSREFIIAGPILSQVLGRDVLVGVLPLSKADGSFDGTVSAAIDVAWLDHVHRQKRLPTGAVVALFDKTGKVIASNKLDVAQSIFAKGARAAPGSDGLLAAATPDGEAWSFAMAPMVRRDYFVGFAMPSAQLFRFTYVHVAVDLLLPVLMVIMASLAIWSATDRLAARWISLLQRMATAYRGGHYAIRPLAMKDAPREFRALGDAFADMAQAVQERDKVLREAVEQKALLIKEVHHRVKNNLQIVISLLSLQSSRLKDPAAREAVEQARVRVNALALVHRMIYEIDRDGLVELKPLFGEIIEQLHRGFGGDRRNVALHLDVPYWSADADLAIPLTLFTIEALTNVYKHGFPEQTDSGKISIKLDRAGADRVKLTVEDDGRGLPGTLDREESTGARLMEALARQVGGEVVTRPRQGGGTVVEMLFPQKGIVGIPKTADRQREPATEVEGAT